MWIVGALCVLPLYAATKIVSGVTVGSGETIGVLHNDDIETSGAVEVQSTGSLSLKSATRITLKPGFEASPASGGAFLASITVDSDGDGMSDAWESQNGLDPQSASGSDGASGNPDGDSLSNLMEYLAGADPQTSTSTASMPSGNPVDVHRPKQ